MLKIFLVEDEENIREIVGYALTSSGFHFEAFENAKLLWERLEEEKPDLFILDIMLEAESGVDILKKLRSVQVTENTPVIMLTARGDEYDKLSCFELGIDDYITKPFSVLELVARVKAIFKRYNKMKKVITYDELQINMDERVVLVQNREVNLTYKEFEILKYLLDNLSNVVTREALLRSVWGYDFEGESRTIDMHIKTLRKKLGVYGDRIKTVRGVGFKISE